MTNPMLAELDERLASLKGDLAALAKFAPAPGVLCAPTMEMGIGWKAKALLPKIEAAHATLADMAKRLEAADKLLRDIAGCQWFNREAPATVELIDAHLQAAAATQEGEG